jgi:ATP-dependent DNA helicase DinG
MEQLRARVTDRPGAAEQGLQCAARPAIDLVRETAGEAAQALAAIEAPLLALARHLEDVLDEETDSCRPRSAPGSRGRCAASTAAPA